MISPELEAQIYLAVSETLAPLVGRDVDEELLEEAKEKLQEALAPFDAMLDRPIEVTLSRDATANSRLKVAIYQRPPGEENEEEVSGAEEEEN